jgi:hypothetical protein
VVDQGGVNPQPVTVTDDDGCSGQQVAAGCSCEVTVGFTPIAAVDEDASLLLITNASSSGMSFIGLSGTGIDSAPPGASAPGASGAPGAPGAPGATGVTGRPGAKGSAGPSGKNVTSIFRCVFRPIAAGKQTTAGEICTARVPARRSRQVRVDISRGRTTYGIGPVRRGVARMRLHILRAMSHARYLVTVVATNGRHATVTLQTAQFSAALTVAEISGSLRGAARVAGP